MHRPRSLCFVALRTLPLALVAICAGCWEKIEYTGPRTTSVSPRTSTPDDEAKPSESAQAVATQPTLAPDPPAVAAERSEPTPSALPDAPTNPPTEAVAAQSTPDEDRYAQTVPEASPTLPSATPPAADSEKSASSGEADASTRHTDATPVSATADAAPTPNAIDSHRAAWLLGSRLSLAALANDRHVAANNVPIWLEDARTAAKLLGTTVMDLPEPAAADDKSLASQQVINYLVVNGQRIGRELSKQHGPEQSALFEVALKSNILLLLYTPGASAGNSIAAAITRAAPQAKLSDEHWKPLIDALDKQVPQADVRMAVKKMHVDIDRYLAERAERNGQ